MRPAASIPHYAAAEMVLDQVLHAIAVLLAVGGVAWLFDAALPGAGSRQIIALTLYGVGVIGMFASAAYNSWDPSPAKELLRRADHAMIFVMIAGTCSRLRYARFPRILVYWPARWHGSSPRLVWS